MQQLLLIFKEHVCSIKEIQYIRFTKFLTKNLFVAESYQTNLLNVAYGYIKELKVPVTITSLKQSLEENPFYTSLYSLSNTFERFHIPHEAFKIGKENLEQLTPPFIAYLKNQTTGKDFVLVKEMSNNEVSYIAENKKIKTISKETFLVDFEKIVLLAGDIDDASGEKEFLLNRKKEIEKTNKNFALTAAGILIFGAIIYFFLHTLPVHFIASATTIVSIKIAGLAVSFLLLIFEIEKSNAFVKSICTAGKQTNCNAVLQSKASKIMGIGWSEIGFFYFAGTLLFLWFPGIDFAAKIFVVSIANLIAAPYILFSVYYQWKVVKQWCPLCLTVQAVLVLELVWAITNFWQTSPLPTALLLTALLPVIFCLLLPFTIWYVIKPLFLKAKNEPVYKAAYKRLLYNPDTFNNLLQQQSVAPDGYQNIGITIGNPDAATTIIKVCNPYCGPCAKAHQSIRDLLHSNQDIQVQIIFNVTPNQEEIMKLPVKHLLAIAEKNDEIVLEGALDDWYLSDKKEYKPFAAKYPLNGELKQQEIKIEKMSRWCKEAEIIGTPTFFINGKRLPTNYNINELKYIL